MKIFRALLVVISLLLVLSPVSAQGGTLTYGSSVVASITAEAPFGLYSFTGNAGDRVMAYAIGITPGMTPSLSLLDLTQAQLATNDGCPFAGGNAAIACVSYRLTQSGTYSLLIANTSGQPGDVLLRLDGFPSSASPVLAAGVPTEISIPPGAQAVTYSFNTDPAQPLNLSISTTSPGFAFTAGLYDPFGQLAAVWAGTTFTGVNAQVAPGAGSYEVTVQALMPQMQGVVTLLLSTGTGQAPAPGPQPTAAPAQPPAPDTCQVTAGSLNVNVRSGPSTDYPIITALLAGSSAPVTGQSVDGTWYVVTVGGVRGWVAASVTSLSGPCQSLPLIQAPPLPTPVPPTAAPAAQITFTVNGTDSVTINPGDCATVEWNVQNVQAVYYQGTGVTGAGSSVECPGSTTTYTLDVTLPDNSTTQRTVTINVNAPAAPDLYVSEFSLNPNPPTQGNPVDVRIGIYNQGTAGVGTSFHIEWYPGELYPTPACTWDIPSMSAGGGRILTCTYAGYPSHYPSINTKVVVDTANTVAESDESNNTYLEAISVSP